MLLPPHIGRSLAAVLAVFVTLGCLDREGVHRAIEVVRSGPTPDSLPVMLNPDLPIRYPVDLYARMVQGNVTLRLHIDSVGTVGADSTVLYESSGYSVLDSAALWGAQELRFRPAKQSGRPLAVSILFPVYFRYPLSAPLPGDTVLDQTGWMGSEVGAGGLESKRAPRDF